GNGFGLTAYGDFGGFRVGAHTDWQVMGTVDYSLNPSWNLHLGYRSLNFNITGSEGRFGFDVHIGGPIIAGTSKLGRPQCGGRTADVGFEKQPLATDGDF